MTGNKKEEIRLRSMLREDISALAEMERGIFSIPWTEQAFADLLTYSYNIAVVAEANGKVIGCVCLTMLGPEGEIDKVMVKPDYRRRGIGAMLVQQVLRQGMEQGVMDFTLEVRKSNKVAIGLYEKMGFVSEGIRPGFYEKPKEDAVIMWRRGVQQLPGGQDSSHCIIVAEKLMKKQEGTL